METLKVLQNQVTLLENYASELQDALTQVALIDDLDDDGNIIFKEKKTIIETMAQAVQLMNDVAGIINSLPDRKQPKIDTGKKGFDFAFWQKAVEKDNQQLGDVLNAIARTPNELQEDDAIWMLSDIANARETLSCLSKEFAEAQK